MSPIFNSGRLILDLREPILDLIEVIFWCERALIWASGLISGLKEPDFGLRGLGGTYGRMDVRRSPPMPCAYGVLERLIRNKPKRRRNNG